MSLNKYRLTESAYIGEELFADADYELERQCASVRHAEERGLMSREQALDAFEVTPEQYTAFLAHNTSHILWPAADTKVWSWTESVITLRVMNINLIQFANHQTQTQGKHLKYLKTLNAALRAMKKLTEEVEVQSQTSDSDH
ncbi:hypothetical protein HH214_21330 [Mucilaginibacter robiniae]|uniref:Uncharacterized protein n=1 Tax=Mucilaginibacter robiniae TaxID=2728022 RepID=A0A7L5E769_9SPHI|nr:hypothetical protein [Mucilaginibacter robiniae]QJD98237.1 hypothetical protein HH214_21330 [Mucilaginibacter robiniae]